MPAESHLRPVLLGHRGCRLRGFPENSHTAFAHAIASGCDGFEFDVRLTSDQRPICLHDDAIAQAIVSTSTYEQLSNEHLKKSHFAKAADTESIPCLPDVLSAYQRSAFLDIELKVPGLERFTLQLLRQSPPRRGFFISSFLPEVLTELAELAPAEFGAPVPLGFIFDQVAGLKVWPNMPGPWVVPRHNLVTRELVDSVHAAGRKLMTWTVNRESEIERFVEWGVDGLVSDDPALLGNTVRGR